MTLGIAYVIWLLPKIGALGGVICLLVGMPLSGVALYRARKRADRTVYNWRWQHLQST